LEDKDGYAVYFFPPALEALGEAIKPFLLEGPTGEHVLCRRIDTAGSLIGMHLYGRNAAGEVVQVELMVPTNMVRMIVSARSDEAFGFGPRRAEKTAQPIAQPEPGAKAKEAPSQVLPPPAAKPKKRGGAPATKPAQPKRTAAVKKAKPNPRTGKRA